MPFRTYGGRARKRTGLASVCILFLSTTAGTSWAAGSIEEVVVTAQRTEESVQDVPIAVTAFTGEMLEEKQIINPSDLQMAAPNVSFTATNFGGSSFSIRGIGNLVVGASEGGVSFHTNEIPLSTNLVAAEFFDMERVEVLRGPQGTLYGRQATGGAINFVTAKPELDDVGGHMDVEYGDYDHQRLKGAINLPVTETFGIRVAGMTLERDGYIENTAHNQVGDCLVPGTTLDEYNADPAGSTTPCTLSGIDDDVDGRDLYSYRATALWTPTDQLSGWIMFSKFHENDDRARITNQICKTNDLPVNGCDPDGFGFDKPHLGATTGGLFAGLIGAGLVGEQIGSRAFDAPRGGFREMHTDFEPEYYNDEDTWLGQVQYDFDEYSVTVQGGMQEAQFFSRQDYLMDVGADLYATPTNPTGYWPTSASSGRYGAGFSNSRCNWNDGTAGVFGGCNMPVDTTRVFAYDQSDGESESWTIEARVQSAFEGPFNFLVGASQSNSQASGGNYYVNANTLDLVGLYGVSRLSFPPLYPTMFDAVGDPGTSGELDSTSYFGEVYYQLTDTIKLTAGLRYNDDQRETSTSSLLFNAVNAEAVGSTLPGFLVGFGLLDPAYLTNSVPGREAGGTNWTRLTNFLLGPLGNATTTANEKNIALYHGVSEADWNAAALTPAFSAARFAIDGMVPIVPGFNETRALTGSPTEVDFQETTGRFGVDWQWSDSSMVYGFFTRGYKPGGFNPPINPEFQATSAFSFDSEQVDAFEIGSKNMLFEDTLMLNSSVFYYDYGDLQVSRIANNSSLNDNIDAEIYGLEIEGLWRPEQAPGLSVDFSYSYLKAEAAGGATSIDPMDRTGGDDAFVPLKNIDSGSNTAVAFVAQRDQITQAHIDQAFSYCRALSANNPFNATTPTQATGCPLTAAGTDYADGLPTYFSKSYLNGTALIPAGLPGAGTPMNTAGIVNVSDGFETDIDGNSLPASPENTVKLGVAYDWQLSMGTLTPRLDYHWRGESYGREFNTKGDEIDAWDQLNVSLGFVTTDGAWQALLWVRNLEDEDNVTGHYLTSDTSGFFRNYFLTEPRIWGASLRYNFGGMR